MWVKSADWILLIDKLSLSRAGPAHASEILMLFDVFDKR